ncbi:MAG: hypothetical protein AVDCRST_MAG34-1913 [uncultured Nocardioidaceae bacterium]|uniref:Sulfatase N-terminal domain-containing protein n=1 Tax=uncultured Nocardioidaceae bacterium TaxID=253824 RepID=A0A6J4MAB9_9ACTN|nr:MAG: hypothetical protein AVDCRST_MAG34-1913 [uncultured Nocardioidaceae bacterium]
MLRTAARWLTCAVLVTAVLGAAPHGRASDTSYDESVRTTAATARVESRPNVVVILLDDMRADDLAFMPLSRRLLADEGAQFVNSFSPYPLCCPARASLLTGVYTHNHRVFDVGPPYGFSSFDDRSTFATWLEDAGYDTTLIGKYLNGYGPTPVRGSTTGSSFSYVPPGWTTWRASIDGGMPADDPEAGGTYRYFDTTLSENGSGFTNYRGSYQTTVYGTLSEEVIRRNAAAGRPFVLYASYTAPHHGGPVEPDDPQTVVNGAGQRTNFATPARPARIRGKFDSRITASPGASWNDPDFTDKPSHLRSRPPLSQEELLASRAVARQRAESLFLVDKQVKRTVDVLRETGTLRNTLVVLTSDNGYFLGEQRIRQGKTFPHEPALRVPLLMRGPGIPAGVRRTDPFTSIDLAPTIADLAGVTPSSPVDGVSMLGVARYGDRGWTRAVLTETGPLFGVVRETGESGRPREPGEPADLRYAIGIRTQRWLYVDYATGEEELYNLVRDPQQYRNVVAAARHADTVELLRRELQRMRACDGLQCRMPMAAALQR